MFALAKLKFIAKLLWNIDLWPRHSYLTDAFIPGRSDLDLSIYVLKLESAQSFLRLYRILKRVMPFLGEISIYTPETIEYIKSSSVNGFELERDPILLKKFDVRLSDSVHFTKERALSYLFMALINDLHKLKKNPRVRLKKWRYHVDHFRRHFLSPQSTDQMLNLDKNSIPLSVLNIVTGLSLCRSEQEALVLRSKLRVYFEFVIHSDIEDFGSWIIPLLTDPTSQIYPYFFEYVCHFESDVPTLTESQIKIMSSQIDWYLLRVLRQTSTPEQLRAELKRLSSARVALKKFNDATPGDFLREALLKSERVAAILNK